MKDKGKRIQKLQKKEMNLVNKGNKAVDEGRDRKADRLLKRAAKVENKWIKKQESMYKYGGKKKTKKKM